MTEDPRHNRHVTRRGALLAVGLAGTAAALAGCSTAAVAYDSDEAGVAEDIEPPTPAPGSGGILLAATSDIPVGGGKIFPNDKVVVTQPTAGQFKAFSAFCTHMYCMLDKVADGTIDCPCHGSTFDISNGVPTRGPATKPLPAEPISVKNGNVLLT
jgi:Rieske Fe-S protein